MNENDYLCTHDRDYNCCNRHPDRLVAQLVHKAPQVTHPPTHPRGSRWSHCRQRAAALPTVAWPRSPRARRPRLAAAGCLLPLVVRLVSLHSVGARARPLSPRAIIFYIGFPSVAVAPSGAQRLPILLRLDSSSASAVVDFPEIERAPWGFGVPSVIGGGFLVCHAVGLQGPRLPPLQRKRCPFGVR